MTRTGAILACMLLAVAASAVRVGAEGAGGSPHHMTRRDGSLDEKACGGCHTPDMGLPGKKVDSCILCHGASPHSGAMEHLQSDPARVAELLSTRTTGGPPLPLSENGGIWCGTCHLFHDPKVLGEKWLERGWVPPESGLPGLVRRDVSRRWDAILEARGEKGPAGEWAEKGTRQLRLPYEGGVLCLQCHGALR